MKIYDCFLYCNEDVVLDIRLNVLDKFVDQFVIVESQFYHNGEYKGLNFNKNKFSKFKSKINYIPIYTRPKNLDLSKDPEKKLDIKIMNAIKYENNQRNNILRGLKKCNEDDIVILSDIDEIPNLESVKFKNIKNNVIFFNQNYFYYKLNLYCPKQKWAGSRAIKYKNLKSPQWLRNLKVKKYPFWRIDKFFNKMIYRDFYIIKRGGWHFSYLNNSKGILQKLKTYLHYTDFEKKNINEKIVQNFINKKKPIYNLSSDQRGSKLNSQIKLKKINPKYLPAYILKNRNKFKNWLI